MSQRHRIESAVSLPNFEPSRFPRFDFVNDAVIDVLERRRDNPSESIAILADQVDACFESSLLSGRQQSGRLRAELWIILVQRIQQQQITKMKQRRLYFRKIQILPFPESVRAA